MSPGVAVPNLNPQKIWVIDLVELTNHLGDVLAFVRNNTG